MLGTMPKTLGEILKTEREKKGLSQRQLAAMSGVSRPYINLIESGQRVSKSTDVLNALAKALDIPVSTIMGIEQGRYEAARMVKDALAQYQAFDVVALPVRGVVPASAPRIPEEESGEFLEVPRKALGEIPAEGLYALKISGDSLRGDGIYSGDSVVVDENDKAPRDGKIYIVRLGAETCARHVYKQNDSLRLVSPDNVSQDMKASEVEILGRVILSGRWKKH